MVYNPKLRHEPRIQRPRSGGGPLVGLRRGVGQSLNGRKIFYDQKSDPSSRKLLLVF